MAWVTPKTNWVPADGIQDSDLNRIEGNSLDNRDNILDLHSRFMSGFEMNSISETLFYTTGPGVCVSDDGLDTIKFTNTWTKNISTAWSIGAGGGSLAPGSSSSSDAWYYIFVIKSSGGVVDIAADDNAAGTNVALMAQADKYRRIGAVKRSSLISNNIVPLLSKDGFFHLAASDQDALRSTLNLTGPSIGAIWSLVDSQGVALAPDGLQCRLYGALSCGNGDIVWITNSSLPNSGSGNNQGLEIFEYGTIVIHPNPGDTIKIGSSFTFTSTQIRIQIHGYQENYSI